MKRLRKYAGLAVVFIGLGLIFFYIKSEAPCEGSLEFVMPPGGVKASKIQLEYRKAGDGCQEPLRRVEKFPRAALASIVDTPSLPEGEYVVELTLWLEDGVRSFSKRYHHGTGDVTKFEIKP
jgi:hypothetical protein